MNTPITGLNLERLAARLTWFPYDESMLFGIGTLVRDKHDDIYLVGDALENGFYPSCGCCSFMFGIVEIAYLSELLQEG